jgi:hypothetical protein
MPGPDDHGVERTLARRDGLVQDVLDPPDPLHLS